MNREAILALMMALFDLALVVVGALILRCAARREADAEAEADALWAGAIREPWPLATIQGFLRNKCQACH